MSDGDPDTEARAVFAGNRYMTLGTADAHGTPWVSPVWTLADVTAPARHRLYHAVVTERWVLDPHDERVPVTLA